MQPHAADILLVEDNPGDVFLIRAALTLGPLPKRINVVTDGEQALNYLARKGEFRNASRPDLILLDLNLPKIDGREVLETVKADPNLHFIPILILSTSTAERDIFSSYEHHANCYLSKPQHLEQFLDLVQRVENYWLECVALPAL